MEREGKKYLQKESFKISEGRVTLDSSHKKSIILEFTSIYKYIYIYIYINIYIYKYWNSQVFWPGEFCGLYSPWGVTKSRTWLSNFQFTFTKKRQKESKSHLKTVYIQRQNSYLYGAGVWTPPHRSVIG